MLKSVVLPKYSLYSLSIALGATGGYSGAHSGGAPQDRSIRQYVDHTAGGGVCWRDDVILARMALDGAPSASHCSMPPQPPRVGSTLKQILIRIYVNIYGVRIGHSYYLQNTALVNIISIKYMTFRDMHLLHVI